MLFLVITITFLWNLLESILTLKKRKKDKEEIRSKLKDFYIKYDVLLK